MSDTALPVHLTTFPVNEEVDLLLGARPRDLELFYVAGVPRSFVRARYRATASLTVDENADGQKLITFGSTLLNGAICVDPKTGEVIQIVGPKRQRVFVNTNLSSFSDTIQAVSRGFPYYSKYSTDDEIEVAATRIEETVRTIDPRAIEDGGYWSTVVSDVRMGDWSTEDISELVSSDY